MTAVDPAAASSAYQKIDWEFALSVAKKVNQNGLPQFYSPSKVADDFEAATKQAAELVDAETGLIPDSPVKSQVIGRDRWVEVNIASFQRLMRPLFEKLDAKELEREAERVLSEENRQAFSDTELGKILGGWAKELDGPVEALTNTVADAANTVGRTVGPKLTGLEMGGLLGFISSRVLGQYDLLIDPDHHPQDQDWVYYVGPNIVSVEQQFGFPSSEYRLWIAIHECTHRAQFMGVPWLRPYFLSLVEDLVSIMDSDSSELLESLKRLRSDSQGGTAEGGILMKMATPEQKAMMDRVSGLMSLLEGHADVVMDRAGKGLIPSQQRFSRVMSHRRANARGLTRFFQKATGMDAKLAQYADGEKFIYKAEEVGGREMFDQVWQSPESLPTLAEIKQPLDWISRISA